MAKRSKESVDYQTTPKRGAHCSQCRHYIAPNTCEGVAGWIDPQGWCKRFSKRAQERNWYGKRD